MLECVQTGVCEGAYRTTVGQSDEMARPGKRIGQQGQLRIIGGQWRGRNLSFTPEEGLRPTSDRIRETLFNWLTLSIHGARCLDLFAGSGALGLEALSRGAAHCDFVDISGKAVQQISRHLSTLSADTRGGAARCVDGRAFPARFPHMHFPHRAQHAPPVYHGPLKNRPCALAMTCTRAPLHYC